jgi:hypothetical protein
MPSQHSLAIVVGPEAPINGTIGEWPELQEAKKPVSGNPTSQEVESTGGLKCRGQSFFLASALRRSQMVNAR